MWSQLSTLSSRLSGVGLKERLSANIFNHLWALVLLYAEFSVETGCDNPNMPEGVKEDQYYRYCQCPILFSIEHRQYSAILLKDKHGSLNSDTVLNFPLQTLRSHINRCCRYLCWYRFCISFFNWLIVGLTELSLCA